MRFKLSNTGPGFVPGKRFSREGEPSRRETHDLVFESVHPGVRRLSGLTLLLLAGTLLCKQDPTWEWPLAYSLLLPSLGLLVRPLWSWCVLERGVLVTSFFRERWFSWEEVEKIETGRRPWLFGLYTTVISAKIQRVGYSSSMANYPSVVSEIVKRCRAREVDTLTNQVTQGAAREQIAAARNYRVLMVLYSTLLICFFVGTSILFLRAWTDLIQRV